MHPQLLANDEKPRIKKALVVRRTFSKEYVATVDYVTDSIRLAPQACEDSLFPFSVKKYPLRAKVLGEPKFRAVSPGRYIQK